MFTQDQPSTVQVAMYTKSATAQAQLLKISRSGHFKSDFAALLSHNPNLAPEIWTQLWDQAPDEFVTARLISSAPTVELAAKVLLEKNPRVLKNALDLGIAKMDDQLLGSYCNS